MRSCGCGATRDSWDVERRRASIWEPDRSDSNVPPRRSATCGRVPRSTTRWRLSARARLRSAASRSIPGRRDRHWWCPPWCGGRATASSGPPMSRPGNREQPIPPHLSRKWSPRGSAMRVRACPRSGGSRRSTMPLARSAPGGWKRWCSRATCWCGRRSRWIPVCWSAGSSAGSRSASRFYTAA
jgi:hypothetical protein